MFESLIRRKFQAFSNSEEAFESTTVSLSTGVPRPAERREEERFSAMLRVGKLTDSSGNEQLIKVKNLSAGGVMAILTRAPEVGDHVQVELSSERIPASVVWIRENAAGLKFDQNIDLGELLAVLGAHDGVEGELGKRIGDGQHGNLLAVNMAPGASRRPAAK